MVEKRAVAKVVIVGGGHNGLVTAAPQRMDGRDRCGEEREGWRRSLYGPPVGSRYRYDPVLLFARDDGIRNSSMDLELETPVGFKKANQWGYFAPRQDGYLQLPDDDPQLLEKELTTKAGPNDLLRFKEFKPTLKKINAILQTGRNLTRRGESICPHARTAKGVGWRHS